MGNNKQMKRITVRNRDVLLVIIVVAAVDVNILIAWTMLAPLEFVRTHAFVDGVDVTQGFCQVSPSHDGPSAMVFIGLGLAWHTIVLIFGNILAFRTRHVKSEFSESKYIAIAMISNLQVLILGLVVMVLVADDSTTTFFVRCGVIFLNDFCVQVLVFGLKLRQYYFPNAKVSGMEIKGYQPRHASSSSASVTALEDGEDASHHDKTAIMRRMDAMAATQAQHAKTQAQHAKTQAQHAKIQAQHAKRLTEVERLLKR